MADVENIYQMFTRLGGAGFFVKRDSWTHARTAAKVISVGGLTGGALPGTPPYHADGPGRKKLVVQAAISYQGQPPRIEELTSPGTYAYTVIDRPAGWIDEG